ncbi:MAG: hypothetical protein HOG03_22345 [Desulfobacula sp.]|jgi:hypothetical protein|uniref:IS1096 element passenger TnpR family protein n=1 Tax=Desulfobacula sp. TaxID=2593537 RepID=UPI001D4B91C1|nr:hypothetical protein [Desulfobacula sp.]MBT5970469.1 hypothetical protein [Desulfobacula sp.]MBT6339975.1 hypothetical protein [Desulfobacula sp.]MBT6751632.1 hypothetical protein [Desulfobacula sp.]
MENFELYTLKIFNTWDPTDDKNFWECVVEIPDICSLYQLHLFIQDTVDFENDHMFEFYAGRNEDNRKLEFSQNSGYPDDGGDYETITLKDVYPLKGLKLYYFFDYGANWIFEFHKKRKKVIPQKGLIYPRIVSDNGIKLRQYDYEDDDEGY